MELRLKTPSKYLFSYFETVHWYAASGLIDELKSKFFKELYEGERNTFHSLSTSPFVLELVQFMRQPVTPFLSM